ncbi:FAD-binding domain-containing protein, partial [Acidisphaera rubrifaciens]|uniref:FAD-binding domain-containing protein n=1 Tax=Acidisphaera rubrifaciens TaxID=50715 RepID=UPI0006628822
VQQVFWRTYWKGWLESRPVVWAAYRAEVRQGVNRLATEGGLRQAFHAATEGRTGIACFDAWARDLVAHNWLHNHARMWFASIWCFTLRLPWALGADFFLRHLLDGDAASNTLSWRWVAGLHTPGKHYVARAENIRRHTAGRFDPAGELDESPAPLEEHPSVAAVPAALSSPAAPPRGPVALLLHEDDLLGERLPPPAPAV